MGLGRIECSLRFVAVRVDRDFSPETFSCSGLGISPGMHHAGRKDQGLDRIWSRVIQMVTMGSKLCKDGSESRREGNVLQEVEE